MEMEQKKRTYRKRMSAPLVEVVEIAPAKPMRTHRRVIHRGVVHRRPRVYKTKKAPPKPHRVHRAPPKPMRTHRRVMHRGVIHRRPRVYHKSHNKMELISIPNIPSLPPGSMLGVAPPKPHRVRRAPEKPKRVPTHRLNRRMRASIARHVGRLRPEVKVVLPPL